MTCSDLALSRLRRIGNPLLQSIAYAILALVVASQTPFLNAQSADPARQDLAGSGKTASLTPDIWPEALPETPKAHGTAILTGTVFDPNGRVLPNAKLFLTEQAGGEPITALSGANGDFRFSGLSAGNYTLKIQAEGMSGFSNDDIQLKDGEAQELPKIVMTVAGVRTDIQVVAQRDEIAQAQITVQLEQRVFGVLPNFYTSYLWDAQKMSSKQKFRLALHSVLDPAAFAGYAFIAGIQQANDTYPGYNQGAEGYGKRVGAAFANDAIGRITGSAIYPSLFRQDPRYFYKGSGSKKSRFFYAIAQAFVCRGDNGNREVNFSHILGTFTAAGLSNLYHPASDRGVSLTITTGLIQTGGNAANNIVREFLFKRLTPKVPDYGKGKQ
jgi:hypothetical protein